MLHLSSSGFCHCPPVVFLPRCVAFFCTLRVASSYTSLFNSVLDFAVSGSCYCSSLSGWLRSFHILRAFFTLNSFFPGKMVEIKFYEH